MRISLFALPLALVSACSTPPSVSPEGSTRQVAAATDDWRAAYDSRDPKRIAMQYAADAALWGTNLKAIAVTPAAVAEYGTCQ